MANIENPMVTRFGYGFKDPQDVTDDEMIFGYDALGDEIYFGDKYVEIGEDKVLLENLKEYVDDVFGIQTAE